MNPSSPRYDCHSHFSQKTGLKVDDIQIVYGPIDQRPTGEARVQFATIEDTDAGFAKNRQNIRNRYIEIFRCTPMELMAAKNG